MSIASRITAIEEHIGNAYDRIEDLGIDLTNVDKNINNIATELEEIYNDYPKITSSNVETASMSNTKAGRMGIDLKGNTSQGENPSPTNEQVIHTVNGNNNIKIENKNLFDNTQTFVNGQYYNGTYSEDVRRVMSDYIPIEYGKSYTMFCDLDNLQNVALINYNLFDENKNWLGDRAVNGETTSFSGAKEHSFTVNLVGSKYIRIVFRGYSSGEANLSIQSVQNSKKQLEFGSTASTYTTHQEQKLELDLIGNNKFDEEFEQGSISSSGTETTANNRIRTKNYIKVNPSTQYTFKTNSQYGLIMFVFEYKQDKTFIQRIPSTWADMPYTFTTSSNTKYIRFAIAKESTGNIAPSDVYNSMLNIGSTAMEYEAYYNYELANIGTAIDRFFKAENGDKYYDSLTAEQKSALTYGRWYYHNEVGDVILDGITEYWTNKNITDNYLLFSTYAIDNLFKTSDLVVKSNYFTYNSNLWTDDTKNGMCLFNLAASLRFRIDKTLLRDISTVENATNSWKTWLSAHNTKVKYPLKTPIDTEITQTSLINQLEAIAKSYNEVTNISQINNDLPFILDLEALRGE